MSRVPTHPRFSDEWVPRITRFRELSCRWARPI